MSERVAERYEVGETKFVGDYRCCPERDVSE
jgi:hypothetical protein